MSKPQPMHAKTYRWYEQNPMMAEAMLCWKKFHPRLQRAVAKQIVELVEMDAMTKTYVGAPHEFMGISLKKLPRLKGMVLRRRWYDREPMIRRAINELAFVIHSDMLEVARAILVLKSLSPDDPKVFQTLPAKDIERMVKDAFFNSQNAPFHRV